MDIKKLVQAIKEKDEVSNKKYVTKLKLEHVKQLQEENSNLIVGGSVALFLHGYKLERWLDGNSDFDLVLPYFSPLKYKGKTLEKENDKTSGNSFDSTYKVAGIKADLKIDPTQEYKEVTYDGFTYKVTNLETIIAAKVNYMNQFDGQKHREDIINLIIR